jgi:hypothetical protein
LEGYGPSCSGELYRGPARGWAEVRASFSEQFLLGLGGFE